MPTTANSITYFVAADGTLRDGPQGSIAQTPRINYGTEYAVTLSFPPSTIAEGDQLQVALNRTRTFFSSASATGDAPVAAVVKHDVTAAEAAAQEVAVVLSTNTRAMIDQVNGIDHPVRGFFGVHVLRGQSFVTLAVADTLMMSLESGPDAISPSLPVVDYPTREEAVALVERSEVAAGRAETAQGKAEEAQGKAEEAQGKAEEAQGKAEAAEDNAQTSATNAHNSEVGARNHEKSAEEKAAETAALYESVKALISHIYVAPAYGYGVTKDNNVLSFTWCDPADNDVVKWLCSRLIFKRGGFPENENDGEVLVDNYIHNAYKTHPFVYDMGSTSDYYFAIFTQSTGGIWNTGPDAPRFTTADLTWATIGMMSRAGTLLQYPKMQIGSVVDIKVNELYPLLRYKLVHVDYKGTFENINDFMYDNTLRHNSIWIPEYLPCYGEGNMNADMAVFDQPELEYGETWDTLFLAGRAYYTVSGETYTKLSEGTDYDDGTSIADWIARHGTQVYNKNNISRVSNGNNIWKESNRRQQLNARGTNWFVKQNPFDVYPGSSTYKTGWLTGFDDGFLAQVMPVYNKTARNNVSALTFGGGGGYDMTLDTFWLPSLKEVYNTNVNNIAEGYQFDYFKNVATTNSDRIQRDNGGTARFMFLRSCNASTVNSEYTISTSGASTSNYPASYSIAFLPAMCVA